MELSKAIDGINKYRDTIAVKNQWTDPIGLSDSMLKLSVYNSYLSDHIAEMHMLSTQKRLEAYKVARDSGETQGDSETTAKIDSLIERTKYEELQHKYKSTDNIISTIQSKLRIIENQMRREGQNGI